MRDQKPEMIAIGASFGGFDALKTILSQLPFEYLIPIAIVQHRSVSTFPSEMDLLVNILSESVHFSIIEVEDKEKIKPAHVFIAPADYHLLVEDDHFSLSIDPPVAFARPSVDVLFKSCADRYGSRCVSVLLTGENSDGSEGVVDISKAGGKVLIQDPSTAKRSAMPHNAINRLRKVGLNEFQVLNLEGIIAFLVEVGLDQEKN